MTKYVFVTGGVVSSLGKGIAAASLAAILESRKIKVSLVKLDPYINVDPGTMSPFQHGEVFVTEDGAETDLDLGHHERFNPAKMTKANTFTTGQIYERVINKERRGDYLGGTVQVIPHITDEIKASIKAACKDAEVGIIEIGGTVGDIESLPFLEAIRQMGIEEGRVNTCYIHLTLVPHLASVGEIKTKPTQHSVKELRGIGIQPDIVMCRSEALNHAGIKTRTKVKIHYVDSEQIEAQGTDQLKDMDAVLVPGGFGKRGIEGKIAAVKFARENNVPYLGICLGMQIAAIEIARNKVGLEGANSTEFDPDTPHPVIALITEWQDKDGRIERPDEKSNLGGTMRLGAQPASVKKGTLAHRIYGSDTVAERHRHRYEVNNHYVSRLESAGRGIRAKSKAPNPTRISK